MVEISPKLFVGSASDYEEHKNDIEFTFVQACKEPYHKEALGYAGRSPDKNHPEYLIAYRDNRIILNMVDADKPDFFSKEHFIESLNFIQESLNSGKKVLIHCNMGVSRSPSIGLLYMAKNGLISKHTFWDAKVDFLKVYPAYFPKGIAQYIASNWKSLTHD